MRQDDVNTFSTLAGSLTRRRLLGVAAGGAAAALLAACGDDDGPSASSTTGGASTNSMTDVTVMLDFTPNPLDAWLWVGMAEGYYKEAGIKVKTRVPPATLSAIVQLVGNKQVQFGLSEVPTIMYGRSEGIPVISVAQTTGQRADGFMFLPDAEISGPEDLVGKRYGQFNAPSFKAELETTMQSVGKSTKDVRIVNNNFNSAPLVAQKKVDAADGLFNSERVTLMDLLDGEEPGFLRFAQYGVPAQPVSSLITNEEWAQSNDDLVRRFVEASMRSIKRYLTDEEARRKALAACCTKGPTASGDIKLQVAKFDAGKDFWLSPGQTLENADWGFQNLTQLKKVLDWAVDTKIADEAQPVGNYFTNEYLTSAARNPSV